MPYDFILWDALSITITLLVAFIALLVVKFSFTYFQGDHKSISFLIRALFLGVSVIIMVTTDHLGILLISFLISNFLLVKLMVHKTSWQVAVVSGKLAARNFIMGGGFLCLALWCFYFATKSFSIQYINSYPTGHTLNYVGAIFLVLAALTQSGIWPFHRWLLSSLNSPTPVSALMHAGVVNAGGFLLLRFASLFSHYPFILDGIFLAGIITAILGTGWKLLQPDVKRMLACSTMGQMGFMFVQCGLGLFSAALIHLCCHSLFKAYLFLASGSAAQEKRFPLHLPVSKKSIGLAFICGLWASFLFSYTHHKLWITGESTFLMNLLVLLVSCQIALPILSSFSMKRFFTALLVTSMGSLFYGYLNYVCEHIFVGFYPLASFPLHAFHWLGITLLLGSWMGGLFLRQCHGKEYPQWILKLYVKALNQSQPHPATVTSHRVSYKYF